jgi:GNAT superfamily N-acetyltransferase
MKRSGLDATVATNSENGDERPRYLAHMGIEIRVCPPDRFRELLKLAGVAFSEDVPDDLVERVERVADRERFFTALDAEQMVATSGVFTMRMSVPGGEVPTGGISFVTVLPSHRRRGLMSGMMRLMIDDCRHRGEPLAALWAAEGAIYQRFGFGMATMACYIEAEPRAVGFARDWPREGECRLLPAGEGLDLVAPVYEAARAGRAGFLGRTPGLVGRHPACRPRRTRRAARCAGSWSTRPATARRPMRSTRPRPTGTSAARMGRSASRRRSHRRRVERGRSGAT